MCPTAWAKVSITFKTRKHDLHIMPFLSNKLQISTRALGRMSNGACWWRRGQSTRIRAHTIVQPTRCLITSAPRCLRLTCLLYAGLNAVNWTLWQTHYTTTSSSMLGHEYFLYLRASENIGDVSQKAANGCSSSIRTMKTLHPMGGAPGRAMANGARAPPRVMLESWRLKTLRIARVSSLTAIAEHWDPAIVRR